MGCLKIPMDSIIKNHCIKCIFELCFKEVFDSIKLFLKLKVLFIRTFCLSYLPHTLNSQILQLRAQKELVHLLDNLDFKMYFLTKY